MSRARKKPRVGAGPGPAVNSHTATFSIADVTGDTRNTPITTIVERASEDNCRRYHEKILVDPPSPYKRQRAGETQPAPGPPAPDPPDYQHVDDSERYQMGLDEDVASNVPPSAADPLRAPRVVKPSDPALARFRNLRNSYLGNLLRRNGCIWPMAQDLCFRCQGATGENPEIFRCKSCHGDELLHHARLPLHRIEQWNGRYFVPSSLKTLGLRVQLGHRPGERSSEPLPLHTQFVVLHTNGIHEVAVNSCDCKRRLWAGAPEEQLQRAGWFPATDDRPRTCATLEVLDTFLVQTYQAKTTMYDYYAVLEKLTNNAGVKPPYRYHAFLRMVREYSHLLMLKRAGRGHAKDGVMGTKKGELVVKCPACPRPGENLPEGWQDAPTGVQYLYIMFLAINACFRLKRRLVSSELKDPSLGSGWSYMVETKPYQEFLLTVTDQQEMSTCSGLAALVYANTKFSRGYSATGVGMGVCARHEFVQPNGVGDLQRGERFANMDWIFLCILFHLHPKLRKIISYDIACKWWKKLKGRVKVLPATICLKIVLALLRFVVPKMHIGGHNIDCQATYSLNLVPGSAQTDGEGIERPWAHIGGVGTSTKEMGPGSREDTLNGHWGSWNWQKIVGLGERLHTKLDRAKTEYATQLESFTQFSTQQAERVPVWLKMIQDFERNPEAKNPYRVVIKVLATRTRVDVMLGITEKEVLLQFELEESQRQAAGVPGIHSVSPSSFVAAGLDVEDEQRRVRVMVELKKKATTAEQIDVAALRRALNRSIQRLRTLQATYTPASILMLDCQPMAVPLFLPSALTAAQRTSELMRGLAAIEQSLREAQCSTSLERLRHHLHVKSRLLTYKELQAQHQGANTRARALVERNESKIRLQSEKYQMAWAAQLCLADGDAMKVKWQVLRKEDIRRSNIINERTHYDARASCHHSQKSNYARANGRENVREVSWIWTGAALQLEWCKAYARTKRWEEERQLVEEEGRRAKVSLECRAV
ncbi:hypothetical protein K438DRAFT_1907965 [Mycena galopus ATCC 62051]|nr:hypothetical protein K438DRAFT_1907965 [Mycena galopus ATCC 62051]